MLAHLLFFVNCLTRKFSQFCNMVPRFGLLIKNVQIEKIHLFALKRFLNVDIRTPNDLVYGELGKYLIYISILILNVFHTG